MTETALTEFVINDLVPILMIVIFFLVMFSSVMLYFVAKDFQKQIELDNQAYSDIIKS